MTYPAVSIGEVLVAPKLPEAKSTRYIRIERIEPGGTFARCQVWWEREDGTVSNPPAHYAYLISQISNYERRAEQ